jgi:arabinofuranosyltransferase
MVSHDCSSVSITPIEGSRRFRAVATFGVVLAVTVLASAAALAALDLPLTGIDDANIFLAYARNIASGQGIVYYAGGERVEGFTSLAWVLLCSLAVGLSSWPEAVLLAANVCFVTITLTTLLSFIRHDLRASRPDVAPRQHVVLLQAALLCWTFLSPSYVLWSITSLMETALWGMILALGTVTASRSVNRQGPGSNGRIAFLVAAALITRPEGMLVAGVWIAARFLALTRLGVGATKALRVSALPVATYIAVSAALLAFRLIYFGYPLPNTFYAKVSPSFLYNLFKGIVYGSDFVLSHTFVGLALATATVWVWEFWRQPRGRGKDTRTGDEQDLAAWRARMFVFNASLLLAVLPPLLTGGDHFALFRFYQPIWPLLAVPLLGWLSAWGQSAPSLPGIGRPGRVSWGIVVVGLLVISFAGNVPRWDQVFPSRSHLESRVIDAKVEYRIAGEGRKLGATLNHLFESDPTVSIGVIMAGGVAVTYRGPVLDLMGLNNVRMGHSAGDRKGRKNHAAFNKEVFFDLSPDVLLPRLGANIDQVALLGGQYQKPPTEWFPNEVMGGILGSEQFRERYVAVFFPLSEDPSSGGVVAWCRPEVIVRLRSRGVTVHRLSEWLHSRV